MTKTKIIAEIGVNHNGNLDIAKKMISSAKECGADVAKFQIGKPEMVTSKFAGKAKYQETTTGEGESQLEMLRKIALPYPAFIDLKKHCDKHEIEFLTTPFSLDSVEFLQKMDIATWKIPSGEITNLPYLIRIARTEKPIILSTGMCTLEEVKKTVEILKQNNSGEITLLHCNTEYPTPYEDANLRAMLTIRETLGLKVGYSDHTPGIEVPIAAVAMGAVIIEKHFTLDKNMQGPDHRASLEPDELAAMVRAIRNIEKALGSGEKKPSFSEIKNIAVMRKSIVAKCTIKKGEIFSDGNLTVKRPGTGISPMKWFEILGMAAIKDFVEDELIVL